MHYFRLTNMEFSTVVKIAKLAYDVVIYLCKDKNSYDNHTTKQ